MFKKLTLFAGFGVGYVLGAKAGTERYKQMQQKFNELAGKPAVQNATSTVKDTASSAADSAKQTINDKVETISDKASKSEPKADVVVDLGPATTVPPPITAPSAPSTPATSSSSATTPPLTSGVKSTTPPAVPVVTPKPLSGGSTPGTTSDSTRL